MGRPKKDDKAELMISIEQFTRTRDSVITGLTTLQTVVGDLINSYIKHSNSILGGGSGDTLAISNPLALAGGSRDAPNNAASTPAPPEEKKQKRKREKKERDPNAPKRPLTAAFLFSRHARPIVKADLEAALKPGDKLEPNAVNNEINRRWNEMLETDKEGWRQSYRSSMELYRKEVEEYKAKTGAEVPDAEGSVHEDENIEEPAAAGAAESDAEGSDEDEEGEPEKEPTPPPKAPTPPVAKTPKPRKSRAKAAKDNNAPSSSAVAASSPVPIPSVPRSTQILPPTSEPPAEKPAEKAAEKRKKGASKETSPEEPKKKRSRKSKGGAEEAEVPKPSVEAPPPSDKKTSKRKRKSDVA